jgi:type II secretory ATPase GspE/PulE/Tfp pilus assembly ATPase PilB-like protein
MTQIQPEPEFIVSPGGPAANLPEPLAGVLAAAVAKGATDIHVDTWGASALLRFRVDSIIRVQDPMDIEQARRLFNQLKIAANLDFEAIRRPQEGQFRWSDGDRVRDIRVTLIPEAPRNESAHLRVLTQPDDWLHMEHLGLLPEQLDAVRKVMSWPHGLVLIAGPTGSGKTTTMYALTDLEDLRGQVAASIEDPIEFDLPLVRQLEVDEKRGITMKEGLRTLLRMDADVLMIGEIRDPDSAVVAARAALAGRLVLATIHARDAAAAIAAMRYMGVPAYVLASSLRAVFSQILVRKLCEHCATARPLNEAERSWYEKEGLSVPKELRHDNGCSHCDQSGFRGRTGVFQIGVFDPSHSAWLAGDPPEHEIRERLGREGIQPLHVEILRRVADGTTSLREAARVATGFDAEKVESGLAEG